MNQMLHNAIAATRSGNTKEAQLLLTQNLQENPDDVQAWYLLSLLVDSPEKQAVYLGKALALDPNHEKAQERLNRLGSPAKRPRKKPTLGDTAVAISISDDPYNFIAQEVGDTLPIWLADDADSLQLEKAGQTITVDDQVPVTEKNEAASEKVTSQTNENLPAWLQENVSDTWVTEEPPTQVSVLEPEEVVVKTAALTPEPTKAMKPQPKARRKPRKKTRKRTKKEEQEWLNLMLGVLIGALALVFFMLVLYVIVLN